MNFDLGYALDGPGQGRCRGAGLLPQALPGELISSRSSAAFQMRGKKAGVDADVLRVAGTAINERRVEHGHPRDLHQQEGDERRPDDGEPAARGQGEESEAPPEDRFAEVVRVAGARPETCPHGEPVVVRVALEHGELPVGDRFEGETEGKEGDAESVKDGQLGPWSRQLGERQRR